MRPGDKAVPRYTLTSKSGTLWTHSTQNSVQYVFWPVPYRITYFAYYTNVLCHYAHTSCVGGPYASSDNDAGRRHFLPRGPSRPCLLTQQAALRELLHQARILLSAYIKKAESRFLFLSYIFNIHTIYIFYYMTSVRSSLLTTMCLGGQTANQS